MHDEASSYTLKRYSLSLLRVLYEASVDAPQVQLLGIFRVKG